MRRFARWRRNPFNFFVGRAEKLEKLEQPRGVCTARRLDAEHQKLCWTTMKATNQWSETDGNSMYNSCSA